MNVIDSSAWLSWFAGDGNADAFAAAIEASDEMVVPSITLTEVFKTILRQRGEDPALEAIAHMQQGTVAVLDAGLAVDAASLGVEFKLPLADSIIYATARRYSAVVWTQDADFDGLDDVRYFPKVTV